MEHESSSAGREGCGFDEAQEEKDGKVELVSSASSRCKLARFREDAEKPSGRARGTRQMRKNRVNSLLRFPSPLTASFLFASHRYKLPSHSLHHGTTFLSAAFSKTSLLGSRKVLPVKGRRVERGRWPREGGSCASRDGITSVSTASEWREGAGGKSAPC